MTRRFNSVLFGYAPGHFLLLSERHSDARGSHERVIYRSGILWPLLILLLSG